MTTHATNQTQSNSPGLGRTLVAGLIGGGLAAVVNTILLLIAKAAGVAFLAPIGGPDAPLQPIAPINVIMLCLVPALVAALLLAGLGRFMQRPQPVFLAIAGVFLLISLIPDWALPMDSLATRVSLSLMHLIAAVVIVGALLRTQR